MSEEENKPESVESTSEEKQGFWAKNIISIVLILFLIVSGIYAFNRESNQTDKKDDSIEKKVEEIKKSEEGQEAEADEKTRPSQDQTDQDKPSSEKPSNGKQSDASLTVRAEAGDGVTHLARKAIAEYSKQQNLTLSAEQKLYAETVLKNQYYQSQLQIGQSIEFSLDSLDNTVKEAQNLSSQQIKSWSKYVPYVPNL